METLDAILAYCFNGYFEPRGEPCSVKNVEARCRRLRNIARVAESS